MLKEYKGWHIDIVPSSNKEPNDLCGVNFRRPGEMVSTELFASRRKIEKLVDKLIRFIDDKFNGEFDKFMDECCVSLGADIYCVHHWVIGELTCDHGSW